MPTAIPVCFLSHKKVSTLILSDVFCLFVFAITLWRVDCRRSAAPHSHQSPPPPLDTLRQPVTRGNQ